MYLIKFNDKVVLGKIMLSKNVVTRERLIFVFIFIRREKHSKIHVTEHSQ